MEEGGEKRFNIYKKETLHENCLENKIGRSFTLIRIEWGHLLNPR